MYWRAIALFITSVVINVVFHFNLKNFLGSIASTASSIHRGMTKPIALTVITVFCKMLYTNLNIRNELHLRMG
jgi:hypothetical protein